MGVLRWSALNVRATARFRSGPLGARLNYRHAFHAGNFADLVKHAALLALLERLMREPGGLTVIDTHAGAGLYDLAGEAARRSGEGEAGVAALMRSEAPPPEIAALRGAVQVADEAGSSRFYPGSPWLVLRALRAGDRYVGCELQPQEHAALSRMLAGRRDAVAVKADGYEALVRRVPDEGRALVLIDPPFERSDDYRRAVQAARVVRARNRRAVVMIWTPLKDLETFDAFLRDLEDGAGEPVLSLEARIRPLDDPMRMNGCGLALVGAPQGFDRPLAVIGEWLTRELGEGGAARVSLSG